MHVLFKTFNVGNGDCIALLLQQEGREVHILVDCGKFTPEVNAFIEDSFHGTIDYLIVTHIDNDHVLGIISMLRVKSNLIIRNILYNCYQRTPDNPHQIDEKMKGNIKRVMGDLPIVVDMIDSDISVDDAKTLAEVILSNPNWKRAWKKEYITDTTKPVELGEGMGKVTFLSPSQKALNDIDHLYRKLFWEELFKEKTEDYQDEQTIYEALIRAIEDKEISEEENISSAILSDDGFLQLANTPLKAVTKTNEASLAFLWEYNDHGILFMGDADPLEVCKSIKKRFTDLPKPIIYDAVKVSHHGSSENTSNELMSLIDSKRFYFAGKTKVAPSINTIARIVTKRLPEGIETRELYYNRKSSAIKELSAREDLQSIFHFTIQEGTGYEFDC